MLETPQERVKLLKSGISGKRVEELYIESNDFKIVGGSVPIGLIEITEYKNAI